MNWESLVGHQVQLEAFRRAAERDRLSHAYLFVGPAGIGKRTFAQLLAQSLMCDTHADGELNFCETCHNCRQFTAGSHPDLFHISRPEGKTEIPIELFIGPPERRGQTGLCHDITLKPMSARRKIAIIDEAHLLNEASGNSLLKTLEEPPEKSILFLIADKEERILTTIKSRCQLIRFAPLATSDVSRLLLATVLVDSPEKAEEIGPFCAGSLQNAVELLENNWLELRKQIFDLLNKRDYNAVQISQKMIETVEEYSSDATGQRHATSWIIRFVQEYCEAALHQLVESNATGGSEMDGPLDRLEQLYERALQAQAHLDQRLSVANVLEGMFHDLRRHSAV